LYFVQILVFSRFIAYRDDKKVVGVFVRFSCAALTADLDIRTEHSQTQLIFLGFNPPNRTTAKCIYYKIEGNLQRCFKQQQLFYEKGLQHAIRNCLIQYFWQAVRTNNGVEATTNLYGHTLQEHWPVDDNAISGYRPQPCHGFYCYQHLNLI
jgi:hypothetical protein